MTKGRKTGTVLPKTLEKYKQIDELYEQGMNAHAISKEIKMNASKVGKYLKEKGVGLHPYGGIHKANYRVFESIDSEEKAYWLGFLFADGSVTYENEDKKRYVLEIGLQKKDEGHLLKFKDFINCTNQVKQKQVSLNGKVYEAVRIQIYSKILVEDLIKLGCVPRKSLVASFPKIPKDMERHFIRGYFDGDGGLHGRSIEIIGTTELLNHIQNAIGTAKEYRGHGKAKGLRFHGQDVRNFYEYAYRDARVYLERKHVSLAHYIGNDIVHNPNNG